MGTKNKKILIVEDEKPLARTLDLKLKNSGYKTVVASNGVKAIEMIKKGDIDLMLLDLVLPQMDGFAVLEKLKIDNIKVPVIIISNLSQDKDIDLVKEYEVAKYLIKADVPIAEIITNIEECFKDIDCIKK